MMLLVAIGRHMSSEANASPSMPRGSSNQRQDFRADLPGVRTINAQIRDLLGFSSHTSVLNKRFKHLARIEFLASR